MCDKVIVFDDFRELVVTEDQKHGGVPCVHCKTEEEFLAELEFCEGQTLDVVLDHDLGLIMVNGDDASTRNGIRRLLELHAQGFLTVRRVAVVTINPSGRDWIVSELKAAGIDHFVDPAGIMLGMFVPKDAQQSWY